MKRTSIQLTPAEIQSGHDRVKWAEGLIRQLPEDHDGRNSWLMNYASPPLGNAQQAQAAISTAPSQLPGQPAKRAHSHYFRPCPYDSIDVYRVLDIFSVTDPCLQHAVKKLLVAGGRGHKDIRRDIQDSIDTLVRWQEMRAEEPSRDSLQP